MLFIFQAVSDLSSASPPIDLMETPLLSSLPGYTRTATHCLPFTKTSTTLLSMKTRSLTVSPGNNLTGAVSGGRIITSGRMDELDVSIEIRLARCLAATGTEIDEVSPVNKRMRSCGIDAVPGAALYSRPWENPFSL